MSIISNRQDMEYDEHIRQISEMYESRIKTLEQKLTLPEHKGAEEQLRIFYKRMVGREELHDSDENFIEEIIRISEQYALSTAQERYDKGMEIICNIDGKLGFAMLEIKRALAETSGLKTDKL